MVHRVLALLHVFLVFQLVHTVSEAFLRGLDPRHRSALSAEGGEYAGDERVWYHSRLLVKVYHLHRERQKGDGDDDDPNKKKGDGNDDDPNKGNGDDDNREGRKIDDGSGSNTGYDGAVDDRKKSDITEVSREDDGKSLQDKINEKLAEHEHIKRFRLVAEVWSPQTGELSPTLKLKRAFIYNKYDKLCRDIYNYDKKESMQQEIERK